MMSLISMEMAASSNLVPFLPLKSQSSSSSTCFSVPPRAAPAPAPFQFKGNYFISFISTSQLRF